MNRNDRKILKIAEERKWKVTDKLNKLHEIKRQTVPKKRLEKKPGRTILIRNNEVL